jgi:hypothetical protein
MRARMAPSITIGTQTAREVFAITLAKAIDEYPSGQPW